MNGGDEGAVGFFEEWEGKRGRERGEGRLLWFLNISGCGYGYGCGYVPCLLGRVRVLCVVFFFFLRGEISFDGWMDGWNGVVREVVDGTCPLLFLSRPSLRVGRLVGRAGFLTLWVLTWRSVCMYVCMYTRLRLILLAYAHSTRSLARYVCVSEHISSFLPSFFWIGQEGASRVLFSFTLFGWLPDCRVYVGYVLKGVFTS